MCCILVSKCILSPPLSDAILQKFFVDRCHANLHVMLVLEQNEANLQVSCVA